MSCRSRIVVSAVTSLVAFSMMVGEVRGQTSGAPAPASAPRGSGKSTASTPLAPEQLEQLVATIALYSDTLLSQTLMATTYPLEVVQAQRWADANKKLTSTQLATELEKLPWDPSVKSLVNTPQVLTMMSEKLDWTVKLGDAFIAQPKDVMNAVQRLRAKAQGAGNLASNAQQTVTVAPSTTTGTTTQTIVIEQADPQVIYVPTYNPSVVYGGWPYPSYPPYYYYPPTYAPGPGISFGAGLAIGVAWGYAWGNCDWNHSDIDIDIDKNVNINNKIDRSKYKNEFNRSNVNANDRAGGAGGARKWQHDPAHRQGVPYRDSTTAQRYGRPAASPSRDAYRGYGSTAGTPRYNSRSATPAIGNTGYSGTNRPTPAAQRSPSYSGGNSFSRTNTGTAQRSSSSSSGTRSGAYDGVRSGGSQARVQSARGSQSRSSASARPSRGGGAGRRR
jgi:hypothetical protein